MAFNKASRVYVHLFYWASPKETEDEVCAGENNGILGSYFLVAQLVS